MAEKPLDELLEEAKTFRMSEADWEEQRRSFAFGNANVENPNVTRDLIDAEAERMSQVAKTA